MHALNPRTREDYKTGDISQAQTYSEFFWRQDLHFQTEVKVIASGWLLCFLVFRLNSRVLLIMLQGVATRCLGPQHQITECLIKWRGY